MNPEEIRTRILDLADIAELLDVSKATVKVWRTRNITFPPPAYRWAMGPAWDRDQILGWAIRTGRWKDGPTRPAPGRPRKETE